MYGSFTRIESKLREMPIIGFDSEDNTKGTVTLYSFYSDKGPFVTRHYEEAMDYIYSVKKTTIFVAHQLEYDIINYFKHDDYILLNELIYASKLLKATLYGCPHIFIDSMSFFMGSLKKMGEMVGIKKLEGSSFSEKYAITDAKIVYTWVKEFQSRLIHKEYVNLGISVGQISMAIYRRSYMLSKKQITYNNPDILKAYYGGRVEVFYKGIVKDVYMLDINSCYPHVMKSFLYPDTSKIGVSSIDTHEYGFGTFDVYVPKSIFIPPLPYKEKKSGRLFFPSGYFTGSWTYQEMRYAKSIGVRILKEYSGLGTNQACAPFKDFISDYYDKRLISKRAQKQDPGNVSHDFDIFFYKLIMNSNYGKWAQHKTGNIMTRDPLPDYKLEKYIDHPDFKTFKLGPFYSYELPRVEPPKTANFFWGIYVTSYSRIYLHQGLQAIHEAGHTLVYTDTDSIMFQKNNDNIPLTISEKLGDWELEKYDLGVFQQAKGYLLCDEVMENEINSKS